MTKRQVRAVMRRMKEHADEAEEETGEINLVPYMDIVTNIIIFLLASVVHNVALGNINASSPTFSQSGGGVSDTPEEKPLNLTVTITANGFIVAASGGQRPNIPKLPNNAYDFDALTKELTDIKKEFPNETRATFNADAYIPYEMVVKTLDAMREDQQAKILFPDITFAAGII